MKFNCVKKNCRKNWTDMGHKTPKK